MAERSKFGPKKSALKKKLGVQEANNTSLIFSNTQEITKRNLQEEERRLDWNQKKLGHLQSFSVVSESSGKSISKIEKPYLQRKDVMKKQEERIKRLENLEMEASDLLGYAIYEMHGKTIRTSLNSIFLLGPHNKFRKKLLWVTESKVFEFFILGFILLNTISMAFYDYEEKQQSQRLNSQINLFGEIATYVFTFEAIAKITAQGFVISKFSYLRDFWNILDLIIVLTGLSESLLTSVKQTNLRSIRTLRVLRPLKTIKSIYSMRVLVQALFLSLPDLLNVTIFLAFIILIYAILGLQLFMGLSYNKCRLTESPVNATYWPRDLDQTRLCSLSGGSLYECSEGTFCGNPIQYGIKLQDDGVKFDAQIQYGLHQFDNIFQSTLAVFQIITFDSWTLLMYNLQDSTFSALGAIYSSTIVLMGSFFMLNLVLAVILRAFEKISEQEDEALLEEERQKLQEELLAEQAQEEELEKQLDDGQRLVFQQTIRSNGNQLLPDSVGLRSLQNQECQEPDKQSYVFDQQSLNKKGQAQDLFAEDQNSSQLNNSSKHYQNRSIDECLLPTLKKSLTNKDQINEIMTFGQNLGLGQFQANEKPIDFYPQGIEIGPLDQVQQNSSEMLEKSSSDDSIVVPRLDQGQTSVEVAQLKPIFRGIQSNLSSAQSFKKQQTRRRPRGNSHHQQTPEKTIQEQIVKKQTTLQKEDHGKIINSQSDLDTILKKSIVAQDKAQISAYGEFQMLNLNVSDVLGLGSKKQITNMKSLIDFKHQEILQQRESSANLEQQKQSNLVQDVQKLQKPNPKLKDIKESSFRKSLNNLVYINNRKSLSFNKGKVSKEKSKSLYRNDSSNLTNHQQKLKELFVLNQRQDEVSENLQNKKVQLIEKQKQFEKAKQRKKIILMQRQRTLHKEKTIRRVIQQKVEKISPHQKVETTQKSIIKLAAEVHKSVDQQKAMLELKKRFAQGIMRKKQALLEKAEEEKQEIESLQANLMELKEAEEEYFQGQLEQRSLKSCFHAFLLKVVYNPIFDAFVLLVIIANLAIMALDSYPEDREKQSFMQKANFFFFAFYSVEVTVKWFSLGTRFYFLDRFNIFDTIIVIISIVDIFYTQFSSQEAGSMTTALRGFRLLRVFKLAKQWQKLANLISTISKSVKNLGTILLLMLLFIFIYSILGMELFAFKVKFNSDDQVDLKDGDSPQSSFNNLSESTISAFVVLANDGWSTIYFNHYRAVGSYHATLFFISFLIIGQYMLLNLLLAILLREFDEESIIEMEQEWEEEEEEQKMQLNDAVSYKTGKTQTTNHYGSRRVRRKTLYYYFRKFFRKLCGKQNQVEPEKLAETLRNKNSPSKNSGKSQRIKNFKNIKVEEKCEGTSLFFFSRKLFVRRFVKKLVSCKEFEFVILFFIIFSSIQLCLENPLSNPEGLVRRIASQIDILLTVIFILEALLKIFAFGFIFCGRNSYIRNGWNILDFGIVLISTISLFNHFNLGILKVLRLFRVMRPLKMISRNEMLRISISSLFRAVPHIINVNMIIFLTNFIFSIIGISFLKGKYFRCQKQDSLDFLQTQDKWNCLDQGGTWINNEVNFDSIIEAFVTLFGVSNRVGWADTMYKAISSRGIDQEPRQGYNHLFSLFFICFIIIGSFFIVNLFVGVVISSYNRQKDQLGKNFLLTTDQKQWVETKMMIFNSKPKILFKKPNNKIRGQIFDICEHPWFDRVIFLFIFFNTITLTVNYYGQSKELELATEYINTFIALVFAIEAFLKIVAYSKMYFKVSWNVFDFIIVILSFLTMILSYSFNSIEIGPIAIVARSVKIGRVVKLARSSSSIKSIHETFILALPGMLNIGSLLLLFIYIYSIMGVFMFGDIKLSGLLDEHANFQSIFQSMGTLIRITTGENFHLILFAVSRQRTIDFQCKIEPTYQDYLDNNKKAIGCGRYFQANIYFFTFVILVSQIFINLFIAIILQKYRETQDNRDTVFNPELNEDFRSTWAIYDPEATGFMPLDKLKSFLFKLGPPLGWEKDDYFNQNKKQDQFLEQMQIKIYVKSMGELYVRYLEVLEILTCFMLVQKEFDKKVMEEKKLTLERHATQRDKIMKRMKDKMKQGEEQEALIVTEMKNHIQKNLDQRKEFRLGQGLKDQRRKALQAESSFEIKNRDSFLKQFQQQNGLEFKNGAITVGIQERPQSEKSDSSMFTSLVDASVHDPSFSYKKSPLDSNLQEEEKKEEDQKDVEVPEFQLNVQRLEPCSNSISQSTRKSRIQDDPYFYEVQNQGIDPEFFETHSNRSSSGPKQKKSQRLQDLLQPIQTERSILQSEENKEDYGEEEDQPSSPFFPFSEPVQVQVQEEQKIQQSLTSQTNQQSPLAPSFGRQNQIEELRLNFQESQKYKKPKTHNYHREESDEQKKKKLKQEMKKVSMIVEGSELVEQIEIPDVEFEERKSEGSQSTQQAEQHNLYQSRKSSSFRHDTIQLQNDCIIEEESASFRSKLS